MSFFLMLVFSCRTPNGWKSPQNGNESGGTSGYLSRMRRAITCQAARSLRLSVH